MGSIGQVESTSQRMSAADNDPQLALALTQMELRFGNLMSQITLMFNVMLRFMKDGNVAQFRAAKAAMLEMSLSLRSAHEVAVEHLRNLPYPCISTESSS
jgi:hypothetical protein